MHIRSHDLYLLSSDHRSDPIEVLGLYRLIFRPLTPGEWIEVWDAAAIHPSPKSQRLKTMLGQLARGISKLDGQPLRLDPSEHDEVKKRLKMGPDDELTALMEAELILADRFTEHVLEAIDAEYAAWYEEYVTALIDGAKKKRARAASGGQPSVSASDSTSSPPTPTSAP